MAEIVEPLAAFSDGTDRRACVEIEDGSEILLEGVLRWLGDEHLAGQIAKTMALFSFSFDRLVFLLPKWVSALRRLFGCGFSPSGHVAARGARFPHERSFQP